MPQAPVKVRSRRAQPPATVVAQLTLLEDAIGGREALVAALLHAPASRDLQYLLAFVGSPEHAATSLAQLCTDGGITPGELVAAYKAGEINRAQALSTHAVGARLHEVAADTMRHALPHEITCLECEGLGQVASEDGPPATCATCHGRGHHPAEGDLEHKKLALEMGKMLTKGGGINLAVNQQTNLLVGSAGGALEQFQEATDRVLYGNGGGVAEVLDGEVTTEQAVDPDAVTPVAPNPDAPTLDTDWQGHPAP